MKVRSSRERGPLSFSGERNREHIIGVRVKEMNSENRMATAIVMPKARKNLPGIPPIKAMGMKIITREKVVAITARAISAVPSMAAWIGGLPSSRICRKIFSRMMMASSMRIPRATSKPRRVILLRV